MKTLAVTIAVVLVGLCLPALASAATYVVNETDNVVPDVGCGGPDPETNECDLWEAIDLSNSTPAEVDTIEFDVERVSLESGPLPAITQAATIDGTGPDGHPGVELDGETEGYWTYGLQVQGNGVAIHGLAIHHVQNAISFQGSQGRVCGSYLGTDITGDFAEETGVGVDVTGTDNEIGAECADGFGNVISGNGWFGIRDSGTRTQIARNLIGIDAFGDPLPNGEDPAASEPSGGILADGSETLIGGVGVGSGLANTIAYNEGAFGFAGGVVVDSTNVSIRGNSIFENYEQGIFFRFGGVAGPAPELKTASSAEGGSTVVSGTVEGESNQEFGIDLFANEVCDQYEPVFGEITEAGEGETYLGSGSVKADESGLATFEVSVPVQPEGTVLTATATASASGSTSEFSGCLVAPKPTPRPPAPPVNPPPPPAQTQALVPENGETLAAEPVEGVIFIKLPGKSKQVKLTGGMLIPVGSVIDASKGKVTLTSVNKAGEAQSAVFFGGRFVVAQRDGAGLVTLQLRGALKGCAKASGSSATASAAKGRRLWGSGKGKFRTEGNYGSATVRGTVWLTEDRCRGTFIKVRKGVVTVRDFSANETFPLGKGKSYLASP